MKKKCLNFRSFDLQNGHSLRNPNDGGKGKILVLQSYDLQQLHKLRLIQNLRSFYRSYSNQKVCSYHTVYSTLHNPQKLHNLRQLLNQLEQRHKLEQLHDYTATIKTTATTPTTAVKQTLATIKPTTNTQAGSSSYTNFYRN